VLADVNRDLVATYRCVQTSADALLAALRSLERTHNPEQYYAARKLYNDGGCLQSKVARSALFIYLNKTCYNGLYRVNRRGEFNVPAGRYRAPRIADAQGLFAASRALQTAELRCASFETVLDVAQRGDFVYMDSPYDVEQGASGFIDYAALPFGPADQDAQADVLSALDRRGCKVMLSNSATLKNRQRYSRFHIAEVRAPRSISCNRSGRAPVTELVIRNYL
jgi:DNA adenine methylase